MRDRQSRLAQPVAAERAAETAPPQPHQPPPQPEPVPKPSSGSSTLWPQGFTQVGRMQRCCYHHPSAAKLVSCG